VDDEFLARDIVEYTLQEAGYAVTTACDREKAVRCREADFVAIRERDAGQVPVATGVG
jgi:DNA-binding response OmpR family regulator